MDVESVFLWFKGLPNIIGINRSLSQMRASFPLDNWGGSQFSGTKVEVGMVENSAQNKQAGSTISRVNEIL